MRPAKRGEMKEELPKDVVSVDIALPFADYEIERFEAFLALSPEERLQAIADDFIGLLERDYPELEGRIERDKLGAGVRFGVRRERAV